MKNEERIEKLSNNIIQDSEGKFNASFKVKSETDDSIWYDVSWNIYESNIHRAFRCECMNWQLNSNKTGICKHIAALCRKLALEERVPFEWINESMKEITI